MKKSRILELFGIFENKDANQNDPAVSIFAKYLAWSFGKDGKGDHFTYLPSTFATYTMIFLNILRVSDEQDVLSFRQQYLYSLHERNVNQIGNLLDLSSDNNCVVLMSVIEQTLKGVFGFGQGALYFSTINTLVEATALALRNCIISFVTEVWMKGMGQIACLTPVKKIVITLTHINVEVGQVESKMELRLNAPTMTNGLEVIIQFDCNLDCYALPSYSIEGKYFSLGHVLYLLENVIEIWRLHLAFDQYQDLHIRYID